MVPHNTWEMLLSQPKPGSLPPLSHYGQSLLQQDWGGFPMAEGC